MSKPGSDAGESTESFYSVETSSGLGHESPQHEPEEETQDVPEPVIAEEELEEIYRELEEKWGVCVGLYVHGSTIFGNHRPKDLDLIAVVEEPKQVIAEDSPDSQFLLGRCEVSVYAKSCFLEKLENMDLTMLTCLNTPSRFVLKELEDERLRNFKVDLERLEASVISYAVFTWQKFQRVLDEWKDPYKSSKNAYFVFRVLTLGEQLATYGRIVDLKASNHLWEDIKEVYDTLQIQPGDTNVVEALLAHHFAESLRSFRAALAAAQHAQRDEAAEDAAEGAKPIVETCAVCLDALDAEQRSIKGVAFGWVQLVNCRHCFHAACIAKSLRARPDHPACPMCRASVRIDATSDPKLAPWFVREPTFPASSRFTTTRRLAYAGYPATLRVAAVPVPAAMDRSMVPRH